MLYKGNLIGNSGTYLCTYHKLIEYFGLNYILHIMPMPYHWFKDKWKTLRLIICIKLLVQTILLLVQRDYIKTTLKILCTKITTIVRLVDVNITWVLKFGT